MTVSYILQSRGSLDKVNFLDELANATVFWVAPYLGGDSAASLCGRDGNCVLSVIHWLTSPTNCPKNLSLIPSILSSLMPPLLSLCWLCKLSTPSPMFFKVECIPFQRTLSPSSSPTFSFLLDLRLSVQSFDFPELLAAEGPSQHSVGDCCPFST